MPTPIVLLTPKQVASHISEGSYKWDKGVQYGNRLVLLAPVSDSRHHNRYGYKDYNGEDAGGLWIQNNILIDEDGSEWWDTPNFIKAMAMLGVDMGDFKS